MYYDTRCACCVFYFPSPEAWQYKTRNSFHNTLYGMKILAVEFDHLFY